MAIAARSEPDPVRQPGDFRRHPNTGAPYVTSLSKTRKRQGNKPELLAAAERLGIEVPTKCTVPQLHELLGPEPCLEMYGRPSSLGKQIENLTNLQKWSERAVALGLLVAPELLDELRQLDPSKLNLDDGDTRALLDAISVQSKRLAQAGLAAERGTHAHGLTEDSDNERDWIERARTGEDLGIPADVQSALVAAWERMLVDEGIEVLAVETAVVDDEWRQAGTLDRIVRLTRDRQFTIAGGEIVTLPAGWVGVLDVKTGRLRVGYDAHPDHWHGYAVQIASYAQSRPYDPDTETRGEWEWPLDQRWAIIAHLDVLAAINGDARCRLVLVDLEAGRHAGALCVAGREWEKRRNVFSLITDLDVPAAKAVDEGDEVAADASSPELAAPVTPADGEQQAAESAAPTALGPPSDSAAEYFSCRDDPDHLCGDYDDCNVPRHERMDAARAEQRRARLLERYTLLSDDDKRRFLALGIDMKNLDAVEIGLNEVDPFAQVAPPMQHPPRPEPLPDHERIADAGAVTALVDSIRTSQYRDVVNGWVKQGGQAGHSWSPLAKRTVTNFERARAALRLAEATDGDNDYVRLILSVALELDDWTMRNTVSIGALIGVLAEAECLRVIAVAEAFGNVLTLKFSDGGDPLLVGDVAAVLAAA